VSAFDRHCGDQMSLTVGMHAKEQQWIVQ
jgi:hypothetical protein